MLMQLYPSNTSNGQVSGRTSSTLKVPNLSISVEWDALRPRS